MSPGYAGFDLSVTDQTRVDTWQVEFEESVRRGTLPALSIIQPNDHTGGTHPALPTPRAMVAHNDLALGRIVETVSRSAVWRETALFVIEDDAQDGPDHVDAHRTVRLVASPYVRLTVDHTMYSTVSMLRTIELILRLAPMSQFDAGAAPMLAAFTDTANVTEMNRASAYRALPSIGRTQSTPKSSTQSCGMRSRGPGSGCPHRRRRFVRTPGRVTIRIRPTPRAGPRR
jgi:phospholipase C